MRRSILCMTAVVLMFPAAAEANFLRNLFGPRVVTAYYYPAPVVYYMPAPPVVAYPCPVPIVPAAPAPAVRTWATPQPAPPSKTQEPPIANPPSGQPAPVQPLPGSGELRFYDAYAAAGRDLARAGGNCSVAFWNLSDRDVVLAVGGQRMILPRGRSTTLALDRQFVWQIEGRPALVEQVPANESAWEIVIRR